MRDGEPFIGRGEELRRLEACLARAEAGHPAVVAVRGEAGIGKTRLLQEFAAPSRIGVLWGQARERSGAPAFWPWMNILKACVELLHEGVPAGSPLPPESIRLAPILPDAARHLKLELKAGPANDQDRWLMFDAAVALLRASAARTPLVLIIEDLHWGDEATLLLLEHVAAGLRDSHILVVVSYRESEESSETLANVLHEIDRLGLLTRIALGPWSTAEVRQYLAAGSASDPALDLARAVTQRTKGNPFFVREVSSLLASLPGEEALRRVPAGANEAIASRLAHLSNDANELLVTAAVLGRSARFAELRALGRHDEARTVSLVDELRRAAILEERDAGVFDFAHSLLRDAVLQRLSATRQAVLHGEVARELEQKAAEPASYERAAELAHHFNEAAKVDPAAAEPAFRYAKLAAEAARRAVAWESAVEYFTLCLDLIATGVIAEPEPDRPALLTLRGACRSAAAQGRDSWRDLMTAATLYRERGDWGGQANAVLEASRGFAPAARMIGVIAEALDLPGDRDPHLEALLLARRGRIDEAGGQADIDRARELCGGQPSPELAVAFLSYEGHAAFSRRRFDEAAPLLRDAGARMLAMGLTGDAMLAMREEHDCYIYSGAYQSAKDYYEVLIRFAKRTGQRIDEHVWSGDSGAWATMCGDFDLARRRIAESSPSVTYVSQSVRNAVAEATGDFAGLLEALPHPDMVRGMPEHVRAVHASRARAYWLSGDEVSASSELAQVERMSDLLKLGHGLASVDGVLQALGSDALVGEYIELLAAAPNVRATIWASADRMHGTLLLRLGRIEEAETLIRRGLDWCEREGVRVEGARCLADLAEVAARLGDLSASVNLLRRAAALFHQYGAFGYESRARDRLDELQGAGRSVAGLSGREIEVLRLVAMGRTNREIAGELVLSPNTVANHVKSILAKAGLANRAEAAAFAAAQGLTARRP